MTLEVSVDGLKVMLRKKKVRKSTNTNVSLQGSLRMYICMYVSIYIYTSRS